MDDKSHNLQYESELMSEAGNPARGCVWGLILSIPLWLLVAFIIVWAVK